MTRLERARNLTFTSIAVNSFLSVTKILTGIFAHSSVVLADGIDSLSDLFTTSLAYIGVKMSEKEADAGHPYGHENFEAIWGKVLAMLLFVLSVSVFYRAAQELMAPEVITPGIYAIVVTILSIIGKIFLSRYTLYHAKKMRSSVYEADAKNYMNDVLASIGALVGVISARAGFIYLQPLFSMLIAFFIFKIAFELYRDSAHDLSGAAADPKVIEEIRRIILQDPGVVQIDQLRTRRHGKRIFVDADIAVERTLSLLDAHEIADRVHDKIEEDIPEIKHVMIHVNPSAKKGTIGPVGEA
ncbi:MAG TPA: cation transporter [Tissierellia bacterium]|nr:cation transporter [Tissierellia bacterium]